MSFVQFDASTNTVFINTEDKGAEWTTFPDGGKAVQLRKARTEESGFDWESRSVKEVKGSSGLAIYDQTDVACLAWFIKTNIKISFGDVCISPNAIDSVCEIFDGFAQLGKKVVEGSSIRCPEMGGFSGMGETDRIRAACQSIGFNC